MEELTDIDLIQLIEEDLEFRERLVKALFPDGLGLELSKFDYVGGHKLKVKVTLGSLEVSEEIGLYNL